MLPYAGYVDPESTLAIGVHHDGHLEATERTFCSLYHTFMFGFHPFAGVPSKSTEQDTWRELSNSVFFSHTIWWLNGEVSDSTRSFSSLYSFTIVFNSGAHPYF